MVARKWLASPEILPGFGREACQRHLSASRGTRREASAIGIIEPRPRISEDWLAAWIGLFVFALAAAGLYGQDLLGWAVTTSVWTDVNKALGTASKAYAGIGGPAALLFTYAALLVVLTPAAIALRANVARFILAFTAVFALTYASWIAGSFAYFAVVTPADQQKFGIDWSLKLTNEGGFIIALLAGLSHCQLLPALCGVAEGSDPA